MLLRLDPDIPIVWRSPTSVQFGVDRARIVLDDVTAAQERLIAALGSGVPDAGWGVLAQHAGETPDRADALRTLLAPALLSSGTGGGPSVAVTGAGALADELRGHLADADALSPDPRDADLVVLVDAWVVDPADHGAWLRRDVPHLPVVELDGAVAIGPFVEPGRTACLYCVHLHRVDADPAWPAIAAQLWGRPPAPRSRTARAGAAVFAARRIAEHVGRGPDEPAADDGAGVSWRVTDRGAVSVVRWRRHPECSCAAPPESDWAPGAARGILRATTTATATDAPA